MRILTIETATPVEDVAVVEDGVTLSRATGRAGPSYPDDLALSVERVLREAGLVPARLDAIAVSIGPGRFSGLRVGLATAKGLSVATGTRIVPVPTLEALALSAGPRDGVVCAMLDARRGEVYGAVFRVGTTVERLSEDEAAAPERMAARAVELAEGGGVLFVGTGVPAYEDVVRRAAGPGAVGRGVPAAPVPEAIAALAEERADRPVDVEALEPAYVRGI